MQEDFYYIVRHFAMDLDILDVISGVLVFQSVIELMQLIWLLFAIFAQKLL
jgi:hypothetical protein